jgi:enoyl-CoA hydratase/carnithine racemase
LIDEIAQGQSALERALALAQAIDATSPSTVSALKRTLRGAYGPSLSLDEEQRVFLESTQNPDHKEALAAFFEKRPPRFQPR